MPRMLDAWALLLQVGKALIEVQLPVLAFKMLLQLNLRGVAEESCAAHLAHDVHSCLVGFQLAALVGVLLFLCVSCTGCCRLLSITASHREFV